MTVTEVRRVVDELVAEVMNGGFDQYFFNSAGDDAPAAIQALNAIGAAKTAALLAKACATFLGGRPSPDWFKRQADLLDRVNPRFEVFEELDKAFYAYPDDLESLMDAYETRSSR